MKHQSHNKWMQQIGTGVDGSTRLVGQGHPLGNVQKFKFNHTNKWYIHNPAFVLENDTHEFLRDFDISPDLGRKTRPYNGKEKRTCKIAVPAAHRIKLKTCERRYKYLYLACGGARDVVVIAVGNEHGDTSSNPGRDWLHFT